MSKWIGRCVVLLVAVTACTVMAQDDSTGLRIEDEQLIESVGGFGQPVISIAGRLINDGDRAVTDISLYAEVFDAGDQAVAEGYGSPVDECGAGLLLDFALQPGASQAFVIPLEVFETAPMSRFEITPSARETDPLPQIELPAAIHPVVTNTAVAQVEWISDHVLRYGVGCRTSLFTTWDWYTYNVRAVQPFAAVHPRAGFVTPELAQVLQLEDPNFSRLTFAPDGDRLVYQNANNSVFTAGVNGEARRTLYSVLSRRTLQEIYWLPQERFIASYFGGYGDPVYYFVADAEGRAISPALANNPPSITLPGASADGRRVLYSSQQEDGTFAYSLFVATNGFQEVLFEAVPPGNNYPAPLLLTNPADNLVNRIYLPLDMEGSPRLMCYNRDIDRLIDLAPLPFRLGEDERAQWWLSPDQTRIALAVSAPEGGLWVIDVSQLPACGTGVE